MFTHMVSMMQTEGPICQSLQVQHIVAKERCRSAVREQMQGWAHSKSTFILIFRSRLQASQTERNHETKKLVHCGVYELVT